MRRNLLLHYYLSYPPKRDLHMSDLCSHSADLSITPWPSFIRKYSRLSKVTSFQLASEEEGSPSLIKFAHVVVNNLDIRVSGSSRLAGKPKLGENCRNVSSPWTEPGRLFVELKNRTQLNCAYSLTWALTYWKSLPLECSRWKSTYLSIPYANQASVNKSVRCSRLSILIFLPEPVYWSKRKSAISISSELIPKGVLWKASIGP